MNQQCEWTYWVWVPAEGHGFSPKEYKSKKDALKAASRIKGSQFLEVKLPVSQRPSL